MDANQLSRLVESLVSQPTETEWVEFKRNFHSPEEIGEAISALSNSACLLNKPYAYLVFGVEDGTHAIVGTTFKAKSHKIGREDLEVWLCNMLLPRIDFESYEFNYNEGIHISLYKIPATERVPVKFQRKAHVRVGSTTQLLERYPDKESKIWRNAPNSHYELLIAKDHLNGSDITQLLSTETFFDLMKTPYPQTTEAVIERLIKEKLVTQREGYFAITNVGAILFAKDLRQFDNLNRKAVRVIVYDGKNKINTLRDQIGQKGYAFGFIGLIDWINGQLPANEEIGRVLRREVRMYPELAIRELVANAIIHQDFNQQGAPMVEIYSDRIEISNAGIPLINTDRFIDEYQSRNDILADIMRRMGFCEEKGSGLDKVIFQNEMYQLPAINITVQENRTIVAMYAYKTLNDTDKSDKIRACYQHACLKWVSNEKMTNQSLRERFKIDEHNAAIASRIIKDTIDAGLIKDENPENNSRKYAKYVPYWA
jgi:predicted HTH transcriptional regulator